MSHHPGRQVFEDRSGRRRRLVGILIGAATVLSAAIAGFSLLDVSRCVPTPSLWLPRWDDEPVSMVRPAPWKDRSYGDHRRRLAKELDRAQVRGDSGKRTPLYAFHVNWDDASLTSLSEHIDEIDVLLPEWLHVPEDGRLQEDDTERRRHLEEMLRKRRKKPRVYVLVNNYDRDKGDWTTARLSRRLLDPAERAALAEELVDYAGEHGASGVCVDFENLEPAAESALVPFAEDLNRRAKERRLSVTFAVPADSDTFPYARLAPLTERMFLMAYDQHYSDSKAGPVASQAWFERVLLKRFRQVPASEFAVVLGSYGYDWTEGRPPGKPLTFSAALDVIAHSKADITFDGSSLNPAFRYRDRAGRTHHVWLLDATTMFNQAAVVRRLGAHGIGLWRLGGEDPAAWGVLRRRDSLSGRVARSLEPLDVNVVVHRGEGEVMRAYPPKPGRRTVRYDPAWELIVGETVRPGPLPYVVRHWGGQCGKRVAITFDDGPGHTSTARVLETLRRHRVRATFFVIGSHANRHLGLTRRVLAEGHEIGAHTLTHPTISELHGWRFRSEVGGTDRVLDSQLRVRALLFRPPFGAEMRLADPESIRWLVESSRMGFYTVGNGLDPRDWRGAGSDELVRRVTVQLDEGRGKVLLLHDGDGERDEMLRALPRIIDELRARGYEIVPVSELIGLRTVDVNPPSGHGRGLERVVDGTAFAAVRGFPKAIRWGFIVVAAISLSRLLVVGSLAARSRRERRAPESSEAALPRVAVIVPAHCEARVIDISVTSVLDSDYPDMELIVVDDGSTDGTAERVLRLFGGKVNLLSIPRRGKSQALMHGIAHTWASIVVTMDADAAFRPDAIRKLVAHFEDPEVAAVAGNAKVGNRLNMLTHWQALEYVCSQSIDKRAFDTLGCLTVVPGVIGAWRRDELLRVGGFRDDTLAEDCDLTLRLLRAGKRIRFAPDAIGVTEAPETLTPFLRQRLRWVFGSMQAFWKHRDLVFRRSHGMLGLVALPNALLFQVMLPLAAPLIDVTVLATLVSALTFDAAESIHLAQVLLLWLLFIAVDLLVTAEAILLDGRERWRLLPWVLLQRLGYRQLMYWVGLRSLLHAFQGTSVTWRKLERSGKIDLAAVRERRDARRWSHGVD